MLQQTEFLKYDAYLYGAWHQFSFLLPYNTYIDKKECTGTLYA